MSPTEMCTKCYGQPISGPSEDLLIFYNYPQTTNLYKSEFAKLHSFNDIATIFIYFIVIKFIMLNFLLEDKRTINDY